MTLGLGVLFPGQGSQYVGMGRALTAAYPEAAAVYAQADELLGYRLSTLCYEGPEAQLNDTANAQPAIFVTSLAVWEVLRERFALHPAALAGHSLGEYSALVAADVLDFADGLRLVRARAMAMQIAGALAPGGMLAVLGLPLATIHQLCSEIAATAGMVIQVANDNCPGQVVVAGERSALELFAARCGERGALPPTWLKVSVAPHTALMEPALPGFRSVLDQLTIRAPSIPVVANTSADWLQSSSAIYAELLGQLTQTVRWAESMRRLLDSGVETCIELAPGRVLTGLLRAIDRSVRRINVGDEPLALDQLATVAA